MTGTAMAESRTLKPSLLHGRGHAGGKASCLARAGGARQPLIPRSRRLRCGVLSQGSTVLGTQCRQTDLRTVEIVPDSCLVPDQYYHFARPTSPLLRSAPIP